MLVSDVQGGLAGLKDTDPIHGVVGQAHEIMEDADSLSLPWRRGRLARPDNLIGRRQRFSFRLAGCYERGGSRGEQQQFSHEVKPINYIVVTHDWEEAGNGQV